MFGKSREDSKPPSSGRDMHKHHTSDFRPPNDTHRDGRNPSYQSSCGKCEHNVREHRDIMDQMKQMDQHYKEKLQKERNELAQCKEEFKSFKSRMAVDLKNELKAGECESMDSPVNKTQLKAMYDQLTLYKWKKIKEVLRTKKGDRMLADKLIRGMFEASRKDMDEKKKQLEEMFAFHKHSTSPSPKDVVYNKLAAENLQMAVYHSRKEEVVKVPFLKYQDVMPTELASPFRDLAAECYWLGCLMALSNPPLQPDWESLIPGPDPWNFFPLAFKRTSTSSMETERTSTSSMETERTSTSSMETEPINLKAIYEEISSKWPKIMDDFKSKEDRRQAEGWIQEMFEVSRKDMDEKKKQFEELFSIHNTSPSPKDVTVYKKQAAQNLQMVYHSSKEVVKVQSLKSERVPMAFKDLAAECYWLGCLMALNNPPLQPDWVDASWTTRPDAWNIFPPIKLTSSMEVPMQQGS